VAVYDSNAEINQSPAKSSSSENPYYLEQGGILPRWVGMLAADRHMRVAWANETFECFFGVDAEKLRHRSLQFVVPEDLSPSFYDPEKFHRSFFEAMNFAQGSAPEDHHLNTRGNKPCRWLEHRCSAITTGPLAGGYLHQFVDVTRHVEAVHEAKAERQLLRSLVNQVNSGVALISRAGSILFANTRYHEILGLRCGTAIGQNLRKFIPETEVARMEREGVKRFSGGTSVYEIPLQRDDGTRRPCLISGAPYCDEEGEIAGSAVVCTDVADFADDIVKQSSSRILTDAIGYPLLLADKQGCVTFCNGAAKRTFGWTEPTVIGRDIWEATEGVVNEIESAAYRETLRTRGPQSHRRHLSTSYGDEVECVVSDAVLTGRDGEVLGYLSLIHPVGVENVSYPDVIANAAHLHHLTRRQRDVLALVTRGDSNRKIATELGLSESTVKLHVHKILDVLKVDNRTQAALVGRKHEGFLRAHRCANG